MLAVFMKHKSDMKYENELTRDLEREIQYVMNT